MCACVRAFVGTASDQGFSSLNIAAICCCWSWTAIFLQKA